MKITDKRMPHDVMELGKIPYAQPFELCGQKERRVFMQVNYLPLCTCRIALPNNQRLLMDLETGEAYLEYDDALAHPLLNAELIIKGEE